jgi:hypothetical protein
MIAQLVVHKIDRPDVVWGMGPETDDRGIVVVKALAALMAFGKL